MFTKMGFMMVLTNAGGVAHTNCFLVADEKTGQAIIFDAPDGTTSPLLDEAAKRGWEVVALYLTHGHFDHFADHKIVVDRFPKARRLLHPLEVPKTEDPSIQTRLFGLPIHIPPLKAEGFVADGQKFSVGSLEFEALHTPGHSPGHVVYYFPKEKLLIGGDLIIGGSIGRTDLPDSDHRDMEASLQKVMKLPDDTNLLGGHGPATTLGEERESNAYLQDFLEQH